MTAILVIEDEPDLLGMMAHRLRGEGYEVFGADNGHAGLELARTQRPDLVILDLMLPDIPGTEVARRMNASSDTRDIPWMVVSARDEEVDRVVAFELGATDYVSKPFSVRELLLRIRAIVRRIKRRGPSGDCITAGPVILDPAAHRVWVDGDETSLTAREFQLLETLVRANGRVLSRVELLDRIWPADSDVIDRTVDAAVLRLRTKLGGAADVVQTVRGVGYRYHAA